MALVESIIIQDGATATLRQIANPDALILFAGFWLGYDHATGRCELVMFNNTKNYEPQRGFQGLIGAPNVSAEISRRASTSCRKSLGQPPPCARSRSLFWITVKRWDSP